MKKTEKPSRIRFFNADDGSEIFVTKLKIVLPNDESFFTDTTPGREGSIVFFTPVNQTDPDVKTFTIEPGASNLFSVNVSSVIKGQKPE